MITETKIKNYTVFVKQDGEKYIDIFNDFLTHNLKVLRVFRSIEDTKVVLIDTDHGKYILKVFHPKVKNTERFLSRWLKGITTKSFFTRPIACGRKVLTP